MRTRLVYRIKVKRKEYIISRGQCHILRMRSLAFSVNCDQLLTKNLGSLMLYSRYLEWVKNIALWGIVGSPYLPYCASVRISAYGSRFFTSLRMSSSWCQLLPHNSSKSQKYSSCRYPYKQRYTNLKATNPLIQKIRVLYFHFFSVPSLSIKGGAWSRASMRKIITIKAKGICVKWSKPISYWLT